MVAELFRLYFRGNVLYIYSVWLNVVSNHFWFIIPRLLNFSLSLDVLNNFLHTCVFQFRWNWRWTHFEASPRELERCALALNGLAGYSFTRRRSGNLRESLTSHSRLLDTRKKNRLHDLSPNTYINRFQHRSTLRYTHHFPCDYLSSPVKIEIGNGKRHGSRATGILLGKKQRGWSSLSSGTVDQKDWRFQARTLRLGSFVHDRDPVTWLHGVSRYVKNIKRYRLLCIVFAEDHKDQVYPRNYSLPVPRVCTR